MHEENDRSPEAPAIRRKPPSPLDNARKLILQLLSRAGLSLQVFKTALAASLSWLVASALSQNAYPYFAPLAAILTVQVTVADSFDKAVQRITGIILGVIVSAMIGHWLSLSAFAIFLVILVGMAIPTALHLNPQITSQVGVSALLVLAFGRNQGYAFGRITETAVGCAVAIAINALLVPPNAIPEAEAALLGLSRKAAEMLKAFAPYLVPSDQEPAEPAEAAGLIRETNRSVKAMELARQSQKYSPFLQKARDRLEHISYGMSQLERITLQIRGIRRSLLDLRQAEDYRAEYPQIERFREALTATAACVEGFGRLLVHASPELCERHAANLAAARIAQSGCLAEMSRVESLPILREMGGILTDMSRILREVAPDEEAGPHFCPD